LFFEASIEIELPEIALIPKGIIVFSKSLSGKDCT
jgi:hypothetical protein